VVAGVCGVGASVYRAIFFRAVAAFWISRLLRSATAEQARSFDFERPLLLLVCIVASAPIFGLSSLRLNPV